MQRTSGFLSLVACVVVSTGTLVQADTRRAEDPDDAKGPLDIAWIKHDHRITETGRRRLVHTVRLFEPWPVDRLRHRGFIHMFFDLRGDPNWRDDRAVYITYEDGQLHAELFDFAADPPTFIRDLVLRRPDGRTLKITLRKSDLRKRSFGHYDWSVLSFIEERHRLCGESGGCGDWSPLLRHDL